VSWKHLNLAWETPCASIAQKLVLVYLADRANKDTELCWPSITEIAHCTGVSTRQVVRSINELEEAGIVDTKRNRGRTRHNNYWLNLSVKDDTLSPLPADKTGHSRQKKVTPEAEKGDTMSKHCSIRNNQEPADCTPPSGGRASATAKKAEPRIPTEEFHRLEYQRLKFVLSQRHVENNRPEVEKVEGQMMEHLRALDLAGQPDLKDETALATQLAGQFKVQVGEQKAKTREILREYPFQLWGHLLK
jgi:hypothetical protein